MFLNGIKPAPLGSVQDGVLRTVFVKQRVRKLRELCLLVLSQGSGEENGRKVASLYKEHVNEMLYREEFERRDEEYWRMEYEHMKKELVSLHRTEDGGVAVTGLKNDGNI